MFNSSKYRMVVLVLLVCSIGYGADLRESISLNGQWDFQLVLPKSGDAWSKINVPGHWSLQGFNKPYWCGPAHERAIYQREIMVPEKWQDKRLFLRFEGVYYKAEVSIDGKKVGDHESGYTGFEFEVTDFLKVDKKSILKVEVTTWGKYLNYDTMDLWALSGIYRDVKLIAIPKKHIEHWRYETAWPKEKGGKAVLTVEGQLSNISTGDIKAQLKLDGKKIAEDIFSVKDGRFAGKLEVLQPLGWTAEMPTLYDFNLSVIENKRVVDKVEAEIGLREIEIKKGMVYINGSMITFRGVARHDLWPEVGRALDDDMSRQDVELMKKAGVNSVRTSHHTCEPAFIKWADRLGLYIIDNISMSNINEKLQDDPNAREATILRTDETVLRDRNHPSVIVWAMGNEIHKISYQHQQMYARIQELDGSRPTQMPSYSGNEEYPEFVSAHYSGAAGFLWKMLDFYKKPMLSTEYFHSAYDGCGDLEIIWDVFDASVSGAGGTIWEWMDQGIEHNWVEGWQAKWPDKVTIYPAMQKKQEMPCGFGAIKLFTPDTIELVFDGDKGEYIFEVFLLPTEKTNRVDISCDEMFVGVYETKKEATHFKFPFRLYGGGEHKIVMKWDYVGGGHNFDSMKLTDSKGDIIWQLGKKDDSCDEFAKEPLVKKLAKKRMDVAINQGSDGFTYPDRSPQDQFYNVKAVYAPIKISEKNYDAARNKWYLRLKNRLSFTDFENYKTKFLIQFYDGDKIWTKEIAGPKIDLKALASKDIAIDLSFIQKYRKNISAVRWQIPSDNKYDPELLGNIWLNLCVKCPDKNKEIYTSDIKTNLEGDILTVEAGIRRLVFDKSKGALTKYQVDGEDILAGPVGVGIWRPALEHEQKLLYKLASFDWGSKFKKYLEDEFDGEAVRKPIFMKYEKAGDILVVKFINQYLLKNTGQNIMKGYETYEIDSNGRVNLKGCWLWQANGKHLRRIGFDFILDSKFDKYTFSGKGPFRSFVNCNLGYDDCVHQLSRDDKNVISNKTGNYWLKWTSENDKRGLLIDPGWSADIQASVSETITYQRVSRARGVGNKYAFPDMKTQIWPVSGSPILMEIDFEGF